MGTVACRVKRGLWTIKGQLRKTVNNGHFLDHFDTVYSLIRTGNVAPAHCFASRIRTHFGVLRCFTCKSSRIVLSYEVCSGPPNADLPAGLLKRCLLNRPDYANMLIID